MGGKILEEKHKIEYVIQLTGSKIFDIVTYNTAKHFCEDFPGLELEYLDKNHIKIFGELNDFWYEKYQRQMFEE